MSTLSCLLIFTLDTLFSSFDDTCAIFPKNIDHRLQKNHPFTIFTGLVEISNRSRPNVNCPDDEHLTDQIPDVLTPPRLGYHHRQWTPLAIIPENLPPMQMMSLPGNATSIRNDISDSFHCDGRDYGYYADVENDCQVFHVCLPVTYSDGRNQTFRWSFICPEETVFNQEMFTCTRADEAIDCADSPRFYDLNRNFGSEEDAGHTESNDIENSMTAVPEEVGQNLQNVGRIYQRRGRRLGTKRRS
ncbi:hypothetical protein NQ317_018918 [Molorchus minor]|uniref:Chitin-binding type-2 domain-containing protein n=1 Tax=Molorchus minor TaxID=1323400 RepID=A0ABQ9JMA3_9CUCU|nr:hypothetical protein NQ317_018918 [Molorchus minor]